MSPASSGGRCWKRVPCAEMDKQTGLPLEPAMSIFPKPSLRNPQFRAASRPLISALDAAVILGVMVMTPIAWLVPERWWSKLGRGVIWSIFQLLPGRTRGLAQRIGQCAQSRPLARPGRTVVVHALSRYFESNLQVLKCYRPRSGEPEIDLQGIEHVNAALQKGHGVVLWISHFQFYPLISKIAFHRAGISVSHLSHPRHGFSSTTRVGMRLLNPIHTRLENRYLSERVLLPLNLSGDASAAIAQLRQRLLDNGVISIAARETGRRPLTVPFLACRLRLAAGAPNLAYKTQAALLPVHTLKEGPGRFTVIVESPVEVDGTDSRGEALEHAARDYAARLEPIALDYPDQWQGGFYL